VPRDSNGIYTRAVSPYVNGTVANASVVNTEMNDIAGGLTGSLTANGARAWAGNQNGGGYWINTLGNTYVYTTTGSANAYVITTGVSLSGMTARIFFFKASFSNTGPSTLSVDGSSAISIRKNGAVALASDDIVSGRIYAVCYDGANFQLLGPVPSGVYQPLDGTLTALAALSTSADQFIYATGVDTFALATVTSAARSLLDDASVSAMRTTLGLEIGVNVQAYDADLTTWAGLTPSAYFQTLVDDADAATARTTLGLGTAATQNTGTSGANVPLLNAANTWSATQTMPSAVMSSTYPYVFLQDTDAAADEKNWRYVANGTELEIQAVSDTFSVSTTAFRITRSGTTPTRIAVSATLTPSANDGAALGTTALSFSDLFLASGAVINFNAGDVTITHASDLLTLAGGDLRVTTAGGDAASVVTVGGAQTLTNKTMTSPTINGGTIQSRVQTSSESSGTLTSASANKVVACSGGITLPDSVFSAGDMIVFDAGASNRTFTRGSGIAMYLNGTDAASATLRDNEMGSVYWRSASVAILSGAFE